MADQPDNRARSQQSGSKAFAHASAEAERILESCQAVAVAMGCDLPQGLLAATIFVAAALPASTLAAASAAMSSGSAAWSHHVADRQDGGRQRAAAAAEALHSFLSSTSTAGLEDVSGASQLLMPVC